MEVFSNQLDIIVHLVEVHSLVSLPTHESVDAGVADESIPFSSRAKEPKTIRALERCNLVAFHSLYMRLQMWPDFVAHRDRPWTLNSSYRSSPASSCFVAPNSDSIPNKAVISDTIVSTSFVIDSIREPTSCGPSQSLSHITIRWQQDAKARAQVSSLERPSQRGFQ